MFDHLRDVHIQRIFTNPSPAVLLSIWPKKIAFGLVIEPHLVPEKFTMQSKFPCPIELARYELLWQPWLPTTNPAIQTLPNKHPSNCGWMCFREKHTLDSCCILTLCWCDEPVCSMFGMWCYNLWTSRNWWWCIEIRVRAFLLHFVIVLWDHWRMQAKVVAMSTNFAPCWCCL